MSNREDLIKHGESLLADPRGDEEFEDHPAGPSSPTRPSKPLPGLLVPLSHVMTEDARADLARVSPARWRLRVHMHDEEAWAQAIADGTAPDKGDDDELAGYVCVQRAVPVAHCQPDALTWLQQRGFTGSLVLEWLPPPDARRSATMRQFVHVPDHGGGSREKPSAAPVMRPEHPRNPQQELTEMMLEQMRQDQAALRDLIRDMQSSQERVLTTLSEEQRRTISDMRQAYAEQLNSDPLRTLGERVHRQTLERVVDRISEDKDPLDKLVEQVQRVEAMREKIAALADPDARERVNPLEEKIGTALTDLAILWGKRKLGVPEISGEQAANLTKQLAELETEGASLLETLGDEAA
jgi:hypothetical protein